MLRGVRRHLTYANVMVTLLAFLVLTGGAAYAANTIFSEDIVNGEVKTGDIGNNQVRSADVRDDRLSDGGLTGVDIAPGAIAGSEVADGSLNDADINMDGLATPRTRIAQAGCSPTGTAFLNCTSAHVTFTEAGNGPSQALVIATVQWHTNTGGAAGKCALAFDGVNTNIESNMGETTDTTDSNHPGETTMLARIGGVAGESMNVSIRCNETESDIVYPNVDLALVGDVDDE